MGIARFRCMGALDFDLADLFDFATDPISNHTHLFTCLNGKKAILRS